MGLAYNNPVTLTVVSSGGVGSTRSFSIKVTQIECSSLQKGIMKKHPSIYLTLTLFWIILSAPSNLN